ncbi:MAG: hypothetical protein Kow0069_03080 [Promethearchaeota archaeon]
MKFLLVFLSMAGNTRRAALEVAEGLREGGNDVALVEVRDVRDDPESLNEKIAGVDAVGWMSPVYGFREPTIYRKFLRALPGAPRDNFPAFVGATASSHHSAYFHYVAKALGRKGYLVFDVLALKAPSTYTCWNGPKKSYVFAEEEKQRAREFGRALPTNLSSFLGGSRTSPKIKASLINRLSAALTAHDFTLRFIVGKLWVDSATCKRCGICVKNCAWGALVEGDHGLPAWTRRKCGGCCACVNLCPSGSMRMKKLDRKVRYREPGYAGYKPLQATEIKGAKPSTARGPAESEGAAGP